MTARMDERSDQESGDGKRKGIDRADGIVAAAKMYIAGLHVENSTLPMAERASRAMESYLDALVLLCPDHESGPDRIRWSLAARQSMRELLDSLRAAERDDPGSIPATVLARAGAEAVRWDLVDRHASDAELWGWLGDLFAATYSDEVLQVSGESETVAREYLRAIAYHAAALDQQALKTGFVIAQLIALLLPDLLLVSECTGSSLYGVDVAQRGIPARLALSASFSGWGFVSVAAADKLSDIHGGLIQGQHPPGLEKVDLEELRRAVVHLRRQWSSNPPMRRFRRYPLASRLKVVRGYEQAMDLLNNDALEAVAMGTGAWRIIDLSRGGVGASTPRNIMASVPMAGDLVAFCPEEGTKWHIGVVRRVRTKKSHVEIGIATLSASPDLVRVDDGRTRRELCVCDPVRRGDVVRLVGPVGALGENDALFVVADSVVHKLRPLAGALRGKSFDLRIYQVK